MTFQSHDWGQLVYGCLEEPSWWFSEKSIWTDWIELQDWLWKRIMRLLWKACVTVTPDSHTRYDGFPASSSISVTGFATSHPTRLSTCCWDCCAWYLAFTTLIQVVHEPILLFPRPALISQGLTCPWKLFLKVPSASLQDDTGHVLLRHCVRIL